MSELRFLIVVTTITFALFTFGIYKLFREIEPNLCQMTYMFQNPQFTAIAVKGGKKFPNYGLYYYNEGYYAKADISNLNGAPVLFLPGNGGSYKQARSLGSVALRMGTGYNKPHLDYFTIDYNEELSAIFGGYLMQQKRFMELCIEAILKLYKTHDDKFKRKIVIIGHSMGGVLAKSILNDAGWLEKLGIIIFIASPLERPVVYADAELSSFYEQTNQLLLRAEGVNKTSLTFASNNNVTKIVDVVLISIGGGNRDLLVPAELTESKQGDIHAMSTAIPYVWLTCDHLSAVWCLQLVKVINKFLYDITFKVTQGYTLFSTNTLFNLQMAQRHFVGYNTEPANYREAVEFDFETWTTAKNLNFSIVFENGIEKLYQQAVILENVAPYEHIYIAVTHEVGNQWLFGCEQQNCVQNQLLTQEIKQLPSKRGHKSFAILNLAAIFGTFSNWTHLMLRLPITRKYAALYIDIHNAEERLVNLKAPMWFEMMEKNLINETKPGAMYEQLQIKGLTQSFYAFKLNLVKLNCEQAFETTVKIYAPWATGYERFYILNGVNDATNNILINLPKNYMLNSNTTQCALYVELHYDPWCRLGVSYHFSLADTMRNLVQQHFYMLPAHMAAIFIITLGMQLATGKEPKKFENFLQMKSWYIIIAVHLQSNLLENLPFIPQALQHITKHSFYATLIVHGFAMASCCLISFLIHLNLKWCMKIATKFMLPQQTTLTKMHIAFGIFAAIISMACCKGISLALMFLAYFGVIAFEKTGETGEENSQPAAQQQTTATNENQKEAAAVVESVRVDTTLKTTPNVGLQNLPYHITLMSLVLLLIGVNVGDTVAWLKSSISAAPYPKLYDFVGFIFAPVMFVIYILPFIWHLKAPTTCNVAPIFAMILNSCAIASLLLCEEKFYLLNYVIPFTFALLVSKELFCKRQI